MPSIPVFSFNLHSANKFLNNRMCTQEDPRIFTPFISICKFLHKTPLHNHSNSRIWKKLTWKEMTRMHPNQSLDTLISLIILNNIWQFAAFPHFQAVRKAAKHQNKNSSSKSALLIPTVSTSAFHSTNLFLFSRHHTPTNSVTPLSAYKPTHNPQFLQSPDEGLTLETSPFLLFMVANLRFQLSC